LGSLTNLDGSTPYHGAANHTKNTLLPLNMAAALVGGGAAAFSPTFIADMNASTGGVQPWGSPPWLLEALADFHGEREV